MATVPEISISLFLSNLSEDTTAVSQPVLVLGSDTNTYILKTQKVFNESSKSYIDLNCSFINEYLAFCVGDHIGLPQANIAVATIQKDFLDASPELIFNNRFEEGEHFASEFVDGAEKNLMIDYNQLYMEGKSYLKKPWPKFFGNISNAHEVPLIIAFDFLIANKDRFAHPDNFLLISDGLSSRKILAIDHGHSFGEPIWNHVKQLYLYNQDNLSDIEYIKWYVNQFFFYNQRNTQTQNFQLNGFGDIFKSLNQHVDISDINNHCFQEPMNRINTITPAVIDKWINQIPDSWFVNRNVQHAFYKKFLINQIRLLPSIIQYVANTAGFDNYRGGILSWKQQSTGTQ